MIVVGGCNGGCDRVFNIHSSFDYLESLDGEWKEKIWPNTGLTDLHSGCIVSREFLSSFCQCQMNLSQSALMYSGGMGTEGPSDAIFRFNKESLKWEKQDMKLTVGRSGHSCFIEDYWHHIMANEGATDEKFHKTANGTSIIFDRAEFQRVRFY